MIKRSFNPETMRKAVEDYPELIEPDYGFGEFVGNSNNVLLLEDDNLGIAVKEYEGLYTGHYFFKVGGREALQLAKRMMNELIDNYGCKAFRGITPESNRAARWFNRKLGFTSHGIIETTRGPHELFTLTAEDFLKKEEEHGII